MIFDISSIEHIYLSSKYIDFRKKINGIVNEITESMYLDPTTNSIFLFTNKRRNSIRILFYEVNGFWLCQKTLLNHDKFIWVKEENGNIEITKEQIEWLLKGMEINPKKQFKKVII